MTTSETVFIEQEGEGEFALRTFSHQGEQGFAAHTSIAALKAIQHSGLIDREKDFGVIKLISQDGIVSGCIEHKDGQETILVSKKIEQRFDSFTPNSEDIANIIGLRSNDIDTYNYRSLIVSTGINASSAPHLFVPLKSYTAIREAYFNRKAWTQSSLPTSLVDKIFLFAPNTDQKGDDFHGRLLDGNSNVSDPAIGEATPAFAAFLCQQKNVQKGTHVFTIRRGANEARQSHLHVEMDNFGDEQLNLRIGGRAFVTAQAQLTQSL